MRIVLYPTARDDLEEITFYIAESDPRKALNFKHELEEKIASLAHHSLRAPLVPEAGQNIRRLIHGSYVIYYRALENRVSIMRILHAARDISLIDI